VDVRCQVEAALTLHRDRTKAKRVQLCAMVPSERTDVLADVQGLRQVMDILLDNALKYTPPDGVIEVTVRKGERQVEVAVQDTGPGIAPDMREYVFSGQADDVLTRQHGGTGMGLLMARRIAELHEGGLRLEPSERGACFVLSLPIASPPESGGIDS
jgi:signal transduction histidine kinase